MAAGPAVLELLPARDTVEDAATREALRRIRHELESQAAQASVQPTRVTLKGAMTLAKFVEQVSSQTGNLVTVGADDPVRDTRLNVDDENIRFWDAVSDVAEQLHLQVGVDTSRACLVLSPAVGDQPLADVTAGAFRAQVLSLQPRDGVLGIEFTLTPEPRLRPLFLSWSDAEFAARLSPGEELPPFSPDAHKELPAVDRGPCGFSIVFLDPDHKAESAAAISVSGHVVVTTAALTHEFRFQNLTDPGQDAQHTGGVTVTRREVKFSTTRKGVRTAEIVLRVVYDSGGPAFESHRTWVYYNEVFLETPDGKKLPVNDGFETLAEQDGAVAVRYHFRDLPDVPPANLKLVYFAPTAVIEVPLDLEFEGLTVADNPSSKSGE